MQTDEIDNNKASGAIRVYKCWSWRLEILLFLHINVHVLRRFATGRSARADRTSLGHRRRVRGAFRRHATTARRGALVECGRSCRRRRLGCLRSHFGFNIDRLSSQFGQQIAALRRQTAGGRLGRVQVQRSRANHRRRQHVDVVASAAAAAADGAFGQRRLGQAVRQRVERLFWWC